MSDYVAKVRSGDIGSLSSVLGVIVLVVLFTALKPGIFDTPRNFANLLNQSAAVIFIAMGLVFVLLLGEIDLSAGYTAGTAAAVLGVLLTAAGRALVGRGPGLPGHGGRRRPAQRSAGGAARHPVVRRHPGRRSSRLQGVLLLVIGTGGTIPVRDPVDPAPS